MKSIPEENGILIAL